MSTNTLSLRTVQECDEKIGVLKAALGQAENRHKVERRAQTNEEANQAVEYRIALERIEDRREQIARTDAADAAFRTLGDMPEDPEARRHPNGGDGRQPNTEFEQQFRAACAGGSLRHELATRSDRPRSNYQPGLEARSLVKTAPANFQSVRLYDQIVTHLVETSAVLRAGATVLTTGTGEDLRVPRSTALSTAGIVAEGSTIPFSDPTLSSVTLGAYKYAVLVQVSREMVDDTGLDLTGYLARETGVALGNALGNHLINGTGSGQPRGVLLDATAGITGPTGTSTSLGSQQTAGQGTDLLNGLVGSLAEPYVMQPSAGYLLRTPTLTTIRNLKASTGELVGNAFVNTSPYPMMVDPFVPTMAANAKSILFGDWSRYFVRIVNGIRFEPSYDFAFDKDMVTFRAVLRADGALIDNTGAIKYFQNSAT